MKTCILLIGLTALLCCGCATDHLQKFYVQVLHEQTVPKHLRNIQPDIIISNNLTNDSSKALRKGLGVVGYADYWSSRPPIPADLRKQARRVGATCVICSIHHRGSETAYRPVYNWVPGTTATYGSSGSISAQSTASFYGNGLYGNAYGNAQGYYNSTASASSPGYLQYAGAMPVTIHYYDVNAVFLRRDHQSAALR
ncbi:MAG TPA: hypothetical protein VG167_03595 [Verrucomicrobiae bacterium]|nr:hypothetical protein [Verrucomicrobiae bacterium]